MKRVFLVLFAFLAMIALLKQLPAQETKPQAEESVQVVVKKEAVEKTEVDAKKKASPALSAKKTGQESDFLRCTRNEKGVPVALETSIVRYAKTPSDKKTEYVDLIGTIHIADKAYYEKLNGEFKKYDAVLYELVAPEGTRVPKGGEKKSGSVLSSIQRTMKNVLDLEFQLDIVDYTPTNFVHADMSPDEMEESMRNRGESVWKWFWQAMKVGLAQQGQGGPDDTKILMALFDKNRAIALKRVMAEEFQQMETTMYAIEGEEGSTLIRGRNTKALEVLKKEMAAGKKKIAIYYGGGHMADMEKQLADDFKLKPVESRWLVAWDMKDKPAKPKPAKETPQKGQVKEKVKDATPAVESK